MQKERWRRSAAGRHGVISRQKLIEDGVSRHRIDFLLEKGDLERALPRTYVVAGSTQSWDQCLHLVDGWAGNGAALSHETAAVVWRLDGVGPSDEVHVTLERHTRAPAPWVKVHKTCGWRKRERVQVGKLWVTCPERTLTDCSATVLGDRIEILLDSALRRRLTSYQRLDRYLDQTGHGSRGCGQMRKILRARARHLAVPMSVFETKLRQLMRKARLPEPIPQHPVPRGDGSHAYIDFAFPHARLAIEADSVEHHIGFQPWREDRARRNELEALGWRVIHVTYWEMIEEPEKVIGLIRRMLQPELR